MDETQVTCAHCKAVHKYTGVNGCLSPEDRDFLDYHLTHAHCKKETNGQQQGQGHAG